jgi:hypothetical protein
MLAGRNPEAGPEARGVLLELSFAFSAWKSNGAGRWALRLPDERLETTPPYVGREIAA